MNKKVKFQMKIKISTARWKEKETAQMPDEKKKTPLPDENKK